MNAGIKKILVPVDFSDNSMMAKEYADLLAAKFGAEVELMHVVESSPYEVYVQKGFMADVPLYVPAGETVPSSDPEVAFKDLLKEAEKQLVELGKKGPGKYKTRVRSGHAVDQILEEIKDYKADLLVMCTHGWTGLKHLMLGSVTEKVVRLSPIPVLTTRGSSEA
jgi:nucleotide-binding universal stress UspA family protein